MDIHTRVVVRAYTRRTIVRLLTGAGGVLLMTAMLVAVVTASAAAQHTPAVALEDWLQREQAIVDAASTGDRGRVEEWLASEFRLRGARELDRDAWIQDTLEDCPGTRVSVDALRANPFEDVAVIQFDLLRDRDPITCAPAALRSSITDVWVRSGGAWRVLLREAGWLQPVVAAVAQSAVQPSAPRAAWQVSSELSLVATGGNSSTSTIGAGGELVRQTATARTRAGAAFLTSEAEGVTNARSFKIDARHGLRIGDRTELFGQSSYERNRFAGVSHRIGFDAGAAYSPTLPSRQSLRLEAGLGATNERRLDGTNERFAAARAGLAYVWATDDRTQIKQDAAITGDLTSARNWRGTSATSVIVALTRLLSVKASHAVEYRHIPVAGFGRADMRTAAALVLMLKRHPPQR